jgi:hypothetical protein
MLITIAYGLAIVLSLAIVAIGVRFLIAPRVAAAGYGVPAKEDGDPAYLTVKGVRDTCVGLLGLILVAFAGHFAVGLFMLVIGLAPLADAVIVLCNGGTKAIAFGVHVSTALLLLVDAALLFAS